MITIDGRYLQCGQGKTKKGKPYLYHELLVKNGWKNEVITINDYKSIISYEVNEEVQVEVMISCFTLKSGNPVISFMAMDGYDNGNSDKSEKSDDIAF